MSSDIPFYVNHLVVGDHILKVIPRYFDTYFMAVVEEIPQTYVVLGNCQPGNSPKFTHIGTVMGLGIDEGKVIIVGLRVFKTNGAFGIPFLVVAPIEV